MKERLGPGDRHWTAVCSHPETMVGSPRSPLLLLAALIVALALAVSPAAAQGPRKGRLLGGLMEADVNEEGVQEALSFAVSEFKTSGATTLTRAARCAWCAPTSRSCRE